MIRNRALTGNAATVAHAIADAGGEGEEGGAECGAVEQSIVATSASGMGCVFRNGVSTLDPPTPAVGASENDLASRHSDACHFGKHNLGILLLVPSGSRSGASLDEAQPLPSAQPALVRAEGVKETRLACVHEHATVL